MELINVGNTLNLLTFSAKKIQFSHDPGFYHY